MRAFELISRLTKLAAEHGDMPVLIDKCGLHYIGEVDVDTEDTGIIIWPEYEGENNA